MDTLSMLIIPTNLLNTLHEWNIEAKLQQQKEKHHFGVHLFLEIKWQQHNTGLMLACTKGKKWILNWVQQI